MHHVGSVDDLTPHLDGIHGHDILRAGLLVLAIQSREQAMGPAVTVVPIEVTVLREPCVGRTGVGNVSNEHVDVVSVRANPRRVEVADVSSSKDVIAIVEMVVIVISVAEIDQRITCCVCRAGNNTTPST